MHAVISLLLQSRKIKKRIRDFILSSAKMDSMRSVIKVMESWKSRDTLSSRDSIFTVLVLNVTDSVFVVLSLTAGLFLSLSLHITLSNELIHRTLFRVMNTVQKPAAVNINLCVGTTSPFPCRSTLPPWSTHTADFKAYTVTSIYSVSPKILPPEVF